ncbi:unnamed protein product [Sphagnum troendelagicum]|uniref:Uncharacterized protein n=1 Tax=Sphagnum troendelagicum TaxID=128251 RepID=A0ABP0TEH6_9BRYO
MTFMVVDTYSYDVLLGLDFLMKIGAVVDVERGLLQVRHGPGTNVEGDDVDTSDSNDDIDSSEYYDSKSSQLKQVDCEDEFKDADLEELVNFEGLQEML